MAAPSDRPVPPLRDVAVYNPDLLRKEELCAYFIARRPLLERILEDLGHAAQHHLLIGTRGMGKTTMLKRVRFAVEDDEALAKTWMPLTFPEEQYSVTRLSDLYLNCIDALSDALEERGNRSEARQMDARIAAILGEPEDERSRHALAILLEAADAIGKQLLLLLDNIDILFDRLKSQEWALRELLSREKRLLIIGASASHPETTFNYGAAFYDFFRVHDLRGLPENEAREMLLHLADLRGATHVRKVIVQEPARLRTLHTLSGGNPRTLVLLFFVLLQSTEGDAVRDLERLLDHVTPLYKARVEALSTQAQKILDAIAVHWHPITAAETAAAMQLEVGLVSSQITRLVRDGVLDRSPTPAGTKSAYQVAERLLNIWYLMRQSRRVRQRLVWLVEFLKLFYGAQELKAHARSHLGRQAPTGESSRIQHIEYQLALAEAVEDSSLTCALESAAINGAEEAYRNAIAIDSKSAPIWHNLGNLLQNQLGRFNDAEDTYRKATEIEPRNGLFRSSLAWHRYLAGKIDDETEQLARSAARMKPENLDIAHTLACILVRRGKWDEPMELMTRIIEQGDEQYFERTWPDIVRFFADAVRQGRAAESIRLLDNIGFGERWLPLRAALSATIEGRESLLKIAPELRAPAESIFDDLTATTPASTAPHPTKQKKTRKK